MLKGIEIENFKGVAETVSVLFAPITLLFGPNSAGKSSILHAIHYAREVLERDNCDPDLTEIGGPFVDLGGFRELIHLHEHQERDVVLRFWVDPDGRAISDRAQEPYRWEELRGYNSRLHEQVRSFMVSLRVGLNKDQRPVLKTFEIDVNFEPFGKLELAADGRRVDLCNLNFDHPLMIYNGNADVETAGADEIDEDILEFYLNLEEIERLECSRVHSSATPPWGDALWLNFDGEDLIEPSRGGALIYRATAIFVGLGELLREELRAMRYLGPIRETPPRHYSPPLTADPSRWATGLAAWDQLIGGDERLLGETNRWMEAIGSGARVEVEEFKELPLESALMAAMRGRSAVDDFDSIAAEILGLDTKRRLAVRDLERQLLVASGDVGIGISQVVPVVVAAIGDGGDDEPWLVMIEQPELHIHPAVQVELADLFAWRASNRRGVCLLETHSEHLMLRLLRRIQETSSGELPPEAPALKPDQLSVVFVEQQGGEVRALQLRVDETGEFVDRWPRGFFEEREDELF